MKIKQWRLMILHIVIMVSFIIIGFLGVQYFLKSEGYVFGSEVDWLNQHIIFAENYRSSFYETFNLFPDFTMQLSGGVNTAQFVYYGILRPEILLSFLFPMIEMKIFFVIYALLFLIGSAVLCYVWMYKENINLWIAFFISCLFILAGPMFYHSHRHLVFINYIPWQIVTFIGIKQYVYQRKSRWMITGIIGMVLESYFFSVSALFVSGIYAIYCVLQQQSTWDLKSFIKLLSKLFLHVLLGIGICALLLVPTALSMLEQHREAIDTPSLLSLLTPYVDMSVLVYTRSTNASYAIGMGMIAYLTVLYFIYKKDKSYRTLGFLVMISLLFPVVCYALNGFQYVRQKSLIPFLPLIVYMCAVMLEDFRQQKIKTSFYVLLPIFLLPILFMKGTENQIFCFIDAIFCIIIILIFHKVKKPALLCFYIVIPLIATIDINCNETYLKENDYIMYDDASKQELVKEILEEDAQGLYRFDEMNTSYFTTNLILDAEMNKTTVYSSNNNQDFVKFYVDIMRVPSSSSNNANLMSKEQPFFQSMMSVKYLLTKKGEEVYGYRVLKENDDYQILVNESVMPIAYTSNDILSIDTFESLTYPYTMDALFHQVIVEDENVGSYTQHINEIDLLYQIENMQNMSIEKVDNGYHIVAQEDAELTIKLDEKIDKQLLVLDLGIADVKQEWKNSVCITVNGEPHVRSYTNNIYANHKDNFGYVLAENEAWDTLNITFSKGEYTVVNPKAYSMSTETLDTHASDVQAIQLEEDEGAILSGTVTAEEDGYFVTSLLYQKGFHVEIDGEEVSYEKVNTAFVGCKIKKGKHSIRITYEMPGKRIGIYISIISCLIGIVLYVKRNYQIKKGEGVLR